MISQRNTFWSEAFVSLELLLASRTTTEGIVSTAILGRTLLKASAQKVLNRVLTFVQTTNHDHSLLIALCKIKSFFDHEARHI